MACGNLEVCFIMPGGDCHYPSTKLWINCLVFYYGGGNLAVYPLTLESLTFFIFGISLITRVHNNVFITKFSLWSGSTNLKRTKLKCVKRCSFLDIFNLVIRNGCLHLRIPVNNKLGFINQSFLV